LCRRLKTAMAETRSLATGEGSISFPSIVDDNAVGGAEEPRAAEEAHVNVSTLSHRRTISSSILSKLPFLRTNSNLDRFPSENTTIGDDSPLPSGSLAPVQQNGRIRRRKGSLRKTALLGKSVLGRDRKGSDARLRSPLSGPQSPKDIRKTVANSTQEDDTDATPRPSQDDNISVLSGLLPKSTVLTSEVSLSSLRSTVPSVEPTSSRASITSPTLPTDRPTTDDDVQAFSFPRPPFGARTTAPITSGDSYFPPLQPFHSRGPTNRAKSPLATQPQSLASSPVVSEQEWDYSETAYWGYVILIITWLVFVVGMGSCFDVWSWAWDVGETPYAPPELNDDPTLPIVGYYPALMVLTSVMAWVWVVVAWVGMKYFRHAEGRGDDG
jgi:Phosphatidylinositol N-acetylglucosaminyltransferase subunit Y